MTKRSNSCHHATGVKLMAPDAAKTPSVPLLVSFTPFKVLHFFRMDSKVPFPLVSKAHAICAWVFAAIFLFASFDLSLPLIGPAALLQGWDSSNVSLLYICRLVAGFLTGVGLFEWVFAESPNAKGPFVYYHVILSILALYSSIAAAVGALGWLYAILLTLFLIAGILGTTDDAALPMESVSDSSKSPLVFKSHAVVAAVFGIIFLLSTFGFNFPIIGPAALLHQWHMDNASLVYLVRFASGLMFAVALFEYTFYKAVKMQPSFNIYHAVTAALALYSSVSTAKAALGWLYAGVLTAFLVAGVVADRM